MDIFAKTLEFTAAREAAAQCGGGAVEKMKLRARFVR
jgi:hypothetical protein